MPLMQGQETRTERKHLDRVQGASLSTHHSVSDVAAAFWWRILFFSVDYFKFRGGALSRRELGVAQDKTPQPSPET